MSILKPESMVFSFNLFIFSSKTRKDVEVDILKAILIFLPIVFSQARRSAAARDLLETVSFSPDPQLLRRFPQEDWVQLFFSSYKACKLAIATEGDAPTITPAEPDAEIGTENWDQLLLSSYKAAGEGDKATFPEPDVQIGTSSRGRALHTLSRRLKGLFKSSK